ncbi:MAG: hypothetical protein PHO03_06355 [Candidatus Omnitrophica bacterium]|nr:hypothetical protein [Candidatus Omnitrophota bacterium]
MIITKSRDYKDIVKNLKKSDKVSIISCNSCAKICGTGGEKNMEKMKSKLEKDGFKVVSLTLIAVPCNVDMVESSKKEVLGNKIVCIACDAAIHNLKKIFPKKKIIEALYTVGLGAFTDKGYISQVREFK